MDVLDTISNRRQLLENELAVMLNSYKGDNLETMVALADKIEHMCLRIGCPSSVKPMLNSIINGKIKMWASGLGYGKLYEKGNQIHGLNTGRIHRTWKKEDYEQGHFRWNHKGYMVTREDRDFLKLFFIDGIKQGGNGVLCGITPRAFNIYALSENTIRIEINTAKSNDYGMYYYKDKDQLIGNWLKNDVVGKDKETILRLIESKLGKLK